MADPCSTVCLPPPTFPPPDLLNHYQLTGGGLYAATAAQRASLQVLEQQAISNTIADHGLTSADSTAVQTWGRSDALAELWALLVQAIKLPATCSSGQTPGTDCRSTDQQNAVDWMTNMTRLQGVAAAQGAGREFVKWAGLGTTAYDNLLKTNPTTDQLTNFLGGVVQQNGPDSGSGYCGYRSPAPYADEYTGYTDQTCFTPCTSLLGCNLPEPSYDQFTKWGEAEVNNSTFGTTGFAQVSRSVAIGITFGTAAVAAGVSAAILASTLGSVLAGTALASAVFPFAGLAMADFSLAGAISAADAAAIGGGVAASAVAAVVAIVIVAIVIAVLEGIIIFENAALPSKLATFIHDAPGNTPDLTAALNDSSQLQSLYSLFIGATLPDPSFTSCDNTPPLVIIGSPPTPCLNAPGVPGPDNSDLEFGITPKDSTTTTYANSMSWHDGIQKLDTTARINGHWFLEQVTPPGGSAVPAQSLRIHYTDWSGTGHTAWLMGDATNGYKFLSAQDVSSSGNPISPTTCVSDGTCAYSSTIQIVGTDGKDYTVQALPPTPPTINPTASANPVEGSPITFTAHGSSPLGLGVTYSWNFNELNTGGLICIGSGCGTTVSGNPTQFTPTVGGQTQVTLTATDSLGKSTSTTFTVTAADVPPTLSLNPAVGSAGCTNGTTCDVRVTTLGNTVTVSGTITHAGSGDVESVGMDWGDGKAAQGASGGIQVIDPAKDPVSFGTVSGTVMSFSATHTYASGGLRTVGVNVADTDGGSDSASTTTEIDKAPAFTSAAATTFTTSQHGSFTFQTDAYPGASFTSTGALPHGVTLTDNGDGTATLSGTPDAGTGNDYPITVTAKNVLSSTPQDFTLTVNQPVAVTGQPSSESVVGGASGSFTAAASGFPHPTVKWQSSPNGQTGWQDISNATSTTYAPTTTAGQDSTQWLRAIFSSTNGTSDTTTAATFIVDSTAPVTSASDTPSPNGEGWNKTAPSVALSAVDTPGGTASAGSGVASLTYSAAGAQPIPSTRVTGAQTTIPISKEGTTTITYHATDKVGNAEGAKSIVVKYDATPPVVSYTNNAGAYTVDQTVRITCGASDATSGVETTTCADITGPAYSFGLGKHSYSASATDHAGNTGSRTTSFVVTVTNATLGLLTAQFIPPAGHPAVLQKLLATAQALKAHGKAYASIIAQYDTKVAAQVGTTITAAQAQTLEDLANTL